MTATHHNRRYILVLVVILTLAALLVGVQILLRSGLMESPPNSKFYAVLKEQIQDNPERKYFAFDLAEEVNLSELSLELEYQLLTADGFTGNTMSVKDTSTGRVIYDPNREATITGSVFKHCQEMNIVEGSEGMLHMRRRGIFSHVVVLLDISPDCKIAQVEGGAVRPASL